MRVLKSFILAVILPPTLALIFCGFLAVVMFDIGPLQHWLYCLTTLSPERLEGWALTLMIIWPMAYIAIRTED